MKQIHRYNNLVVRSLVDVRSGYENNATTIAMARAVQKSLSTGGRAAN